MKNKKLFFKFIPKSFLRKSFQFFLFVILFHLSTQKGFAYDLKSHLIEGSKGAISGSNKYIWMGGSLLTLVAFNYDHQIYKHYEHREESAPVNSIGDVFGTGVPGVLIALSTMASGWYWNKPHVYEAGVSHSEALLNTFLVTSILKAGINRTRPPAFAPTGANKSSFNASFPSGHTSTAFATAGSIMASAGPLYGIPILLLAIETGFSRIQQGVHYTSDVIFGATLGYTMGTGFYKHHDGNQTLSYNILPYFEDRENFGLTVNFDF